jgi:hypothetical protein
MSRFEMRNPWLISLSFAEHCSGIAMLTNRGSVLDSERAAWIAVAAKA